MAELEFASIFTDNAVLQRGKPIPIWGMGPAGLDVVVSLDSDEVSGVINEAGEWRVYLPEHKAGGPYELKAQCGKETLSCQNVMIGDVWLCSGQSNMEWTLSQNGERMETISDTMREKVRFFTVAHAGAMEAQKTVQGDWSVPDDSNVLTCSAVAWHFAARVLEDVDVPVGLLISALGGSSVEAWISRDRLRTVDFMKEPIEKYEVFCTSDDFNMRVREYQKAQFAQDPGNRGVVFGYASLSYQDEGWKEMPVPGSWESHGLVMDGAVWFRKWVDIPKSWEGKDLELSLSVLDDFDYTYFNGIEVGQTGSDVPDAYSIFRRYRIPADMVNAGEANLIATRIFDHFGEGGFMGLASQVYIQPLDKSASPISLATLWKYKVEVEVPDLRVEMEKQGLTSLLNPCFSYGALHNGMIAPLMPYALKGVLWYQGESNSSKPREYAPLIKLLVEELRELFKDETLPFYSVQLANFHPEQKEPCEGGWAEIREAQCAILEKPFTGIVTAIDVGVSNDIHPRDKKTVGQRLALQALNKDYEVEIACESPCLRDAEVTPQGIRLHFDHLDNMDAHTGALEGFGICNANGNWVWADPYAEKGTLFIKQPQGFEIKGVCYNWANNPISHIYNRAKLPMLPFKREW